MPGVGFKLDQGSEVNWDPLELALTRLEALGHVLGLYDLMEQLKESESPAKELMQNEAVVDAMNSRIMDPSAGKAGDELCQWLYETYQTGDPQYQNVVLRYMPALCGVYISRSCGDNDEPLAGFEAVLLALYMEESKARGGRPLLVHLPNLSQPSLYHTPKPAGRNPVAAQVHNYHQQLSAPLEPQTAVKSTKRPGIVGLALELFYKKISCMPSKAKLEICQHARRWSLMGCPWASHVDEIAKLALPPAESTLLPADGAEVGYSYASGESRVVAHAVFEQPPQHRTVGEGIALLTDKAAHLDDSTADAAFSSAPGSVSFNSATSSVERVEEGGVKVALPLDLLRPILKALGHCLMSSLATPEVQEAAASAARALYVRASEDLLPEAIMAARSLVRLDAHATAEARSTIRSSSLSSVSTIPKPRNSDMFLVPS